MRRTIIHNVNVIDGRGGDPARDVTVVIEGSRLRFIGRDGDIAADAKDHAETIDGRGGFLLPGLVNCHEHLDNRRQTGPFQERAALPVSALAIRATHNAILSLCEGVTAIRDLGAKGQTNLQIRDAINSNAVPGPRVFACGMPLAITGGHASPICRVADGVEEVQKAVREQIRAGADFVKLMASGGFVSRGTDRPTSAQYSLDEMRAAFDEARDAGLKTTVHAHPPTAIIRAVTAGVDCIEHAGLLDDEAAGLMASHGTYLVPTLSESWIMATNGTNVGRPQWLVDASREHAEEQHVYFSRAVKAGLKMAVGTDVIGEMVPEMQLMAAGGLSNAQVIVAATRNGAELIGRLGEFGTLEEGKLADMVLVRHNPLEDLAALENIEITIKDGVTYVPAQVRQSLGLASPQLPKVPHLNRAA